VQDNRGGQGKAPRLTFRDPSNIDPAAIFEPNDLAANSVGCDHRIETRVALGKSRLSDDRILVGGSAPCGADGIFAQTAVPVLNLS
jgi:hypothetical protein